MFERPSVVPDVKVLLSLQPEKFSSLLRAAFNPSGGPLTDATAEAGEKQARSALFAGAIGSYKNPHSHRDVDLSEPK